MMMLVMMSMYFEVVYYSVIFDIEEIYKISHEKRQLSFLWVVSN